MGGVLVGWMRGGRRGRGGRSVLANWFVYGQSICMRTVLFHLVMKS